jgi:hypothetical protein
VKARKLERENMENGVTEIVIVVKCGESVMCKYDLELHTSIPMLEVAARCHSNMIVKTNC